MTRRTPFATLSISALAACALLGAGAARSEGLLRDSDDYNCHHGAVSDGRTLEACARLYGEPVTVREIDRSRHQGLARYSDDLNCHHGAPGDVRTVAACARLRGTS